MAGTIKASNIQIGDSATASQNFVLSVPASPDGTVKLSRGNVGATTQDVLVVNADGGIKGGVAPAFSVYQSVAQSLTPTATKISFQTEEFDTSNSFDSTTNYRFQPSVAGYYQINFGIQIIHATAFVTPMIYKNNALYKAGTQANSSSTNAMMSGSALVFLNGSTDYLELFGSASATANTNPAVSATYLNGYLARAA